MTYTVEPTDHWRPGDRAYCVRGLKKHGRHVVEEGRIYTVTDAKQMNGMMNDGLKLDGVDANGLWGFWSSRFVCIRGRQPAMQQIAERTRHKWYDAYMACSNARNAAQGMSAGTAETQSGSGLQPASPVGNADAPLSQSEGNAP